MIFEIIHLTFSPPDKTLQFLRASSPLKTILPKKLLKNNSSLSSSVLAKFLSHSIRLLSELKKLELSRGK